MADESRRKFIKKTAYVAPVIFTASAAPAFAGQGSKKQPVSDGGKRRYHKKKIHKFWMWKISKWFKW